MINKNGWFFSNDEEVAIYDGVCAFAEKIVRPRAREIDQTGDFPHDIVKQMGQMGLMGLMVSDDFGGMGASPVVYAASMEAISEACASTGVIMSVNNSLVCWPIETFGSPQQKKDILTPLSSGQKLGCFALSEPGNGSDPAGLRVRATKAAGGYIISGSKNWITNGKEADFALVFATMDPEKRHKGISAFIVDTKSKGFSVAKVEDKLGIVGSSTATLFFDDVFVPDQMLLGAEGQGFRIAMSTLDGGRIGIAGQALGISKAALGQAKKFAKEREQFGSPISKLQAIQFFIADMATRLEGARLLTWQAARRKADGLSYTREAAMAKLAASEASNFICDKALQVHGGYGFTKDYDVERHFRDARITEIYEGTSEIQRLVIAAQEFAG